MSVLSGPVQCPIKKKEEKQQNTIRKPNLIFFNDLTDLILKEM